MRLIRYLIDPTLKIHNKLKIVAMEERVDVDEGIVPFANIQ